MAIVVPKQWLYEQDLDVNVLALRESGDLDNLKLKWIDTNSCPVSSETSSAMEIESMSGLFLVFAMIGGFPLLLFAWKKGQFTKVRAPTLVSRRSR